MITQISETSVLETIQESILHQAILEGFVFDETIAIDATHIEAHDQVPVKEDKPKPEPKKRGRKSKEEREKCLQEKAKSEQNLPLYEKPIEVQLDASLQELRSSAPIIPKWGIKKNSEGKNIFWFGDKGHLVVGTKSQYIFQSLFTSGNLNDGKGVNPLLKGVQERFPALSIQYGTMDADYDYMPIYTQLYRMKTQSVITYNKKNEQELIGYNEHFGPTCVREHAYRYDRRDAKYETLKYTRPKECKDCLLAKDSLCQKVYKVKITTDLRKYTAPARGSNALFHQNRMSDLEVQTTLKH